MPSDCALPIGAELRRLRQERGLSLRRAAEQAGTTHSRLREWEVGVDTHTGRPVLPPYDGVRRLARAYGVQADPLLRLAGYGPEPELPPEEQQLLAAFRALPEEERRALLASLTARGAPEG